MTNTLWSTQTKEGGPMARDKRQGDQAMGFPTLPLTYLRHSTLLVRTLTLYSNGADCKRSLLQQSSQGNESTENEVNWIPQDQGTFYKSFKGVIGNNLDFVRKQS